MYSYTKSPISLDRLAQEIQTSSIVTALDHMNYFGSALDIFFKAVLSDDDKSILDGIVTNHGGTPLPSGPQSVVISAPIAVASTPAALPFAQPTHRTKRDATPDIVTVPVNTPTPIDFQMTVERYVSGGEILVLNPEFGDYVTAEVYDKDSVIPSPYRAPLCEAWPSVAKYLVKQFINSSVMGTIIDTYPLNAKITAGLYLRVTYYPTNTGADRKIAVNYHLTKAL